MSDKPPLTYEEVRRVLHLLDPLLADRRIVLVGGQAVAFWGRYLAPRSIELTAAGALTSKDIDFEGSAQSVTRAATLLAGRPKIATMDDNTPNTGIVLFTDSAGIPREIDFIDAPLGLGARDVRDTAVLLALDAEAGQPPVELWIMHPEGCMESRVINTTVLRTTAPLAIRQLAVSVLCAREWSSYLLDSDELPQETRVKAVLKLNERVFKRCMRDCCTTTTSTRFTQSSPTTRSCPISSASDASHRCIPSSRSACVRTAATAPAPPAEKHTRHRGSIAS